MARGDFSVQSRTFSKRSFDTGPIKGRFVGRDYRSDKRFAMRDRDQRHFRHGRRGHSVGGVWVWDYGPDYYAYGDDCWWLRRQAIITGSPYWWRRYNLCVGYY